MLDVRLLSPERPRRLKRTEYERMVELGMLDDERIELLHGTLVEMSPNNPPHASPIQSRRRPGLKRRSFSPHPLSLRPRLGAQHE